MEVEQPRGDLDQALVKVPLLVGRGTPHRFPRLVRVPNADPVEVRHASQEQAIRLGRVQGLGPPPGQPIGRRCRRHGRLAHPSDRSRPPRAPRTPSSA